MITDNKFGEYLAVLRKEKGVTLNQLCDGLCDAGILSRFERGERVPDRGLQERFLSRLGVTEEGYEKFLHYHEFERWQARQDILHFIIERKLAQAKDALRAYKEKYATEKTLEQQFYLVMLAQIRQQEGCGESELLQLYSEALELTVPETATRGFKGRILAIEEINVLLEYRRYCKEIIPFEQYEDLLRYIDMTQKTILSKAKLYPKAVYYFYLAWQKQNNENREEQEKLLKYCEVAIEMLRDAKRSFYLWELLEMEEKLRESVMQIAGCEKRERPDYTGFKSALKDLQEEFGISVSMQNYCYIYIGAETYCIEDVVRVRRKMLGMTMRELGEGICSERVISRLESKKTITQDLILQEVMKKLKLSAEFSRMELITSSHEAKEKYKKMITHLYNWDTAKTEQLIAELKEMVPMEIPDNRQTLLHCELNNDLNKGTIKQEEYIRRVIEVLESTVGFEMVTGIGEKYFTQKELICIQNLVSEKKWDMQGYNECISALLEYCESARCPESRLKMSEFLLSACASALGSQGQFEQSDAISKKLIRTALLNHRVHIIHSQIYNILWNEGERKDEQYALHRADRLKLCLSISSLCKDFRLAKDYEEELKAL